MFWMIDLPVSGLKMFSPLPKKKRGEISVNLLKKQNPKTKLKVNRMHPFLLPEQYGMVNRGHFNFSSDSLVYFF